MTDSNRPRHYSDDSLDPSENLDGYDVEESGVDADFNPAAFAGGAAPAAAPQEEETAQQGLPLRGLAMILIVVALLLIGWGAFSLMGGDDDSDTDEVTASQQDDDAEAAQRDDAAAHQNQSGEEDAPEDRPDEDKPAEDADRATPEADQDGADPAAPGDPADIDRAKTHVTVLNNSPVQGLAGDTANRLRDGQWDASSIGNLPDTAQTFNESTVFYPAGDGVAKAAAEQIAQDLGIKSTERAAGDEDMIRGAKVLEGPQPGGIIVVTTNDLRR